MKPRRFTITRVDNGRPLSAFLRRNLDFRWSDIRQLIRQQKVRIDGNVCTHPSQGLKKGQQVQVNLPADLKSLDAGRKNKKIPRENKLSPSVIRYADQHILIVNKPPGLTTVRHASEMSEYGKRARKFLPPTLTDLLPDLMKQQGKSVKRVRPIHRLDKETSGLMVFALTEEAERILGKQIRRGELSRKYQALVRGKAINETIESNLIKDRGDGRRGSSNDGKEGKHAVTHVKVLEELGDFTLVECRLKTGRTHQIRIHLGERGTPLCGERIYDRPIHGKPLPDTSGAQRLLLHSSFLSLCHPIAKKEMSWTVPPPKEMSIILKDLRKRMASRS